MSTSNGWYANDGNAEIYFPLAATGLDAAEQYVNDGDWGNDGGCVRVHVWQIDGDGDPINEVSYDVDCPVDESLLIEAAIDVDEACGDDPDDHTWTHEGEGGLDENPGWWSTGGTSMVEHEHCAECGLRRHTRYSGAQRNPGEAEEAVEYLPPEDGHE